VIVNFADRSRIGNECSADTQVGWIDLIHTGELSCFLCQMTEY